MNDALDPHEAAQLLEKTRREAERQLSLTSPALSLLGAVVVVVALGAEIGRASCRERV